MKCTGVSHLRSTQIPESWDYLDLAQCGLYLTLHLFLHSKHVGQCR